MMRIVHLMVVCAFVSAAAYVYKIKFEATVQAERVAKIRMEIRKERDMTAMLRAEWAKLDNPMRIQGLAQRHLNLKPIDPSQIDQLDKLPERPAQIVPPDTIDPIAAIIENSDGLLTTGSVPDGVKP